VPAGGVSIRLVFEHRSRKVYTNENLEKGMERN
jgi:hypothetical protein